MESEHCLRLLYLHVFRKQPFVPESVSALTVATQLSRRRKLFQLFWLCNFGWAHAPYSSSECVSFHFVASFRRSWSFNPLEPVLFLRSAESGYSIASRRFRRATRFHSLKMTH